MNKEGYQLFRKRMIDATYNKLFGSILTAINEVLNRIDSIVGNIFVSLYRKDLYIEDLTGYENMTR